MLASGERAQHQIVSVGYCGKDRTSCVRGGDPIHHLLQIVCQLQCIAENGSRLPMREKVAHLSTINAGVNSSYAGEGSIDLADQRINRLPWGDSNIVIHQVFQRKENELVCRNRNRARHTAGGIEQASKEEDRADIAKLRLLAAGVEQRIVVGGNCLGPLPPHRRPFSQRLSRNGGVWRHNVRKIFLLRGQLRGQHKQHSCKDRQNCFFHGTHLLLEIPFEPAPDLVHQRGRWLMGDLPLCPFPRWSDSRRDVHSYASSRALIEWNLPPKRSRLVFEAWSRMVPTIMHRNNCEHPHVLGDILALFVHPESAERYDHIHLPAFLMREQ